MTAAAIPAHLHPGYATAPRPMRVVTVRRLTEDITHFRFAPLNDAPAGPDALSAGQPSHHHGR